MIEDTPNKNKQKYEINNIQKEVNIDIPKPIEDIDRKISNDISNTNERQSIKFSSIKQNVRFYLIFLLVSLC